MKVEIKKYVNEDKHHVEYLLVNFDYYDGNELVAKLFCREFQMSAEPKFDGLWYSIIKLHDDTVEYQLVWHEDVGNYLFCTQQDENFQAQLEQRLKVIVDKLNEQ